MTDHSDGSKRPGKEMPLTGGEAIVQDLLLEDGAGWRRLVPTNDRLNAAVRTLTKAAESTTRPRGREIPDIQPPAATARPVREDTRPRPATRGSVVAAAVAALLVAGLLVTILYGQAGD